MRNQTLREMLDNFDIFQEIMSGPLYIMSGPLYQALKSLNHL